MGLDARKPVFGDLRPPKAQPTPAHPCSLINTFVIHLLERFISKLATGEISIFLASLCSWRDWFESRFVGNPKTGFVTFLMSRPIWFGWRSEHLFRGVLQLTLFPSEKIFFIFANSAEANKIIALSQYGILSGSPQFVSVAAYRFPPRLGHCPCSNSVNAQSLLYVSRTLVKSV